MNTKKLEKLGSEVKKYRAIKLAKLKKQQQEENKEQERQAKFWKEEEKLLPKKLKLCNEIFTWKDEFMKTKQFKELFKTYHDEIIMFYSGWGDELPRFGGPGCWSRLYLEKSGNLKYWAGYKWMPRANAFEIILANDEKTAKKFTYEYLHDLARSIRIGEIYRIIIKDLREEVT